MTTTLPNRIIKYFVDTSNPSQSGFYFYEKAGAGGFVRLGSLADASRAGGNTFEIDSSTAENVIYNGLGGADTYVVRSNLDKNIEISDPHTGDDGSGNEVKNTIVFDSDVTVTSISANQVTRLEGTGGLRIELTLDTGAVITVNGPDVFQYVVGGAVALDFAGFITTYGASGIAPANRAPVIDIASFVSIDENADGSVDLVPVGYFFASDADAGDTLTYSIVSAVDQNGGDVTGFEFVGNGGLVAYVGTGFDAEAITSVVLTVSASDGQESVQTSVTISVTNIDEAIESAPPGLSIDENVDGSRTPVALFQVAMTDARDAVITYSIANAVDQNGGNVTGFDIDGSRGIIRYAGTGLDAETITSVALTISARNGEDSVEGTYAIAVTNIDEGNARFVVTSDGDITAAAVGDVLTVGTISADPDGNDAFTYQWYRDGAEIADATGASYTIPEDYNRNSIYVVVRYTDGSGTNEVVTLSGILAPVPEDNADRDTPAPLPATPAVLNLAEANIIVKYFVDTSNPSESGFYFYEVAGDDNLVRLGRAHEGTLGGDDTFEIDSPTGELVIYNGLGGADTYVIRGSLDNDVQIHDIDFGDDGSGNEVKNTIVFASDVTVTSIYQDRLQGRTDVIKIEQTLDTDAVVTVHVPDAFEYVVGGAAALDFAEFIATYGASGISATNRAPVIEIADFVSIDENADGSADPVPVGYFFASDADAGDTLTYSIISTADQNGGDVTGFEFVRTGGLITYVGTGFDAEAITSVVLTVSASDGQESVQTSVAISVINIDEGNASFVVTSDGDITAAVAGDVLTVGLRTSDPDGDGAFTYQWYRDGVDIAGATGASYTIPENYDGNSIYVAVRYTDGSGADETVTVSGIIVPAPVDNIATVPLPATPAILNLADLDPATGFRLDGENLGDRSGREVSSVGDINNDGYDDFAIGAPRADGNNGSIYVVYGKASSFDANINLSDLEISDGFRIDGARGDHLGSAISGVGDINGDNIDDFITGSWIADYNGHRSGSTFIIYGKDGGFEDNIDLSNRVSSDDSSISIIRIDGENIRDYSGTSVSLGDVNGDGIDDIIIGAERAEPSPSPDLNPDYTGATYVVFGDEDGFESDIELSDIANGDGSAGFRLNGENADDYSGYSVSSGDVNNDGYDDLIIGARSADPNGNSNSGSTYVVSGKALSKFSNGTINLATIVASDENAGFRINGENVGDLSGNSVASAGDFNGDGYDDIIIGAYTAAPNGDLSGSSYVVFGKEAGLFSSETMELSELDGSNGFRIDGENAGDYSGGSVSSAGDFNGDGYDDIIIGAHRAGASRGSTYVVFGKESDFGATVELSDIVASDGRDGFRIDGSGRSVSSAGDVNGDGYDDIITGVLGAGHNGVGSGSSYIIYGHATSGASGITPAPTNRAPVFENEPTDLSIDENADGSAVPVSVGRVVASDADAADTLTYSIVSTADQNGDSVTGFEVDGTGLITYVGIGLDAETITSVALTVSASDGEDSVQTSVAISVVDLNDEAPTITSGTTDDALTEGVAVPNTQVIYTATGTSDVTDISWSLSGLDAGLFNINPATGEVRFETETTPDAEAKDSYSFTVVATSGTLASVEQAVSIAVTNIDEGNASFVVTSDGDLTAAVAGDVLTVGLRSSDPDGDGTFTYQWYRDGVDIAGATGASYTIPEDYDGNSIYVVVRYTDGSGADETVTASGIIVPVLADNDDDASEDPVNTTYTMTQAPTGVSLTRGGVALSVGETFTYQDIQGGSVALTVNDENALSGLRLTTDDGTDANPSEISLDIEVREVADIAAPEVGNDLDYSENEGSLVIDTGDYGDQITAAQGSDFITGGLGDDTINLDPVEGRETGQDTVVYNFGSGSIFTATDGGDDITGFKRGEDIFLLKTESDNPELATLDGLFSYVSGPNKGSSHDDLMIVRPNYEYEPDGDGGHIFFLTGITFHFEDAGVYGNGYLAQGHVSITFDERLPWEEFLSLIEIDNGNGSIDGNFDHRRGIIRDLSTLPNLMGEGSLAYEVEAPAQTPPQDVDVVPLEDDIPATSFDVV